MNSSYYPIYASNSSHMVPSQSVPVRLQDYGVGLFDHVPTKSAWKKAIKKGWVSVDGHLAPTSLWISGGEKIELAVPPFQMKHSSLVMDLTVLYEDDYLAAIAKPSGIEVSGNRRRTIANALHTTLKTSPLPDAVHPQAVHRLDYPTSGVLLLGKTAASIRELGVLFENRELTKTYLAVTIGEMKPSGQINDPIDQKEAVTQYSRITSVPSERFGCLNLVVLQPKTGRRHQLRKHMALQGNYILGDREYCPEDLLLKGKGLYLHALAIKFTHPFTKKDLEIMYSLPPKFLRLFPKFDWKPFLAK